MTANFRKFSSAFSSVNGGGKISHHSGASGRAGRRLGVLTLLALTLSCAGGSDGGKRRTIVDSRDTYDPRSLDPILATDVPTGRAVGYLFDGLTGFDPSAKVTPALAERWDVSPDGRIYTFHLRHGVRFHDG